MSQVDNLLSGGNVLAGAVQAMADASKNPSGVDLAALYMTTYSTVMGGLQILTASNKMKEMLS